MSAARGPQAGRWIDPDDAMSAYSRWLERGRFTRPADGCWEWKGAVRGGYGLAQVGTGPRRFIASVHRIAYTALVGAVPAGLVLDHLCRNTRCLRVDHLDAVPQATNLERSPGMRAHRQRGAA